MDSAIENSVALLRKNLRLNIFVLTNAFATSLKINSYGGTCRVAILLGYNFSVYNCVTDRENY